jgi:hypothetical protein
MLVKEHTKKIFYFLNPSHFRVEHIPSPGQLDGRYRSVDPAEGIGNNLFL